jgi:hypothetical protein
MGSRLEDQPGEGTEGKIEHERPQAREKFQAFARDAGLKHRKG